MSARARAFRIGSAAVLLALISSGVTPAHAEGSWTSYLTQAQPTFTSRGWVDANLDSVETKVVLTDCKANAAGRAPGTTAVRSVTLQLWSGAGRVASIKKAGCGTFNFGRLARGTYRFKISEINGHTSADRKVFLNAAKVSVAY